MDSHILKKLESLGQSVWLDYIKRDFITSGKLKKMIQEEGLSGITSNPSIFENAIAHSHDYDKDILSMAGQGKDINTIYETLTQKDVIEAAQYFIKLYQQTAFRDGYVSLEVSPHLAHNTKGTIIEAQRLWAALHCPNVFIKVPATAEGIPAIKQLISEGININVTLIFSVSRYLEVVEAYLGGLEIRLAQGKSLAQTASVASFFLSRIDIAVDLHLEKILQTSGDKANIAKKILGQTAIASAKIAYQKCLQIIQSERFKQLTLKGAKIQRLLWASTSTKNPADSDIKYIETLIGPDTINTLPMETLEAYKQHGNPALTLESTMDEAESVFQSLQALNIDMNKITQQLEEEGIEKFKKSFDALSQAIQQKISAKES